MNGNEFELEKPRTTGSRQLYRNNQPSSTAKDYFRISLYDEFLSHAIANLESRFIENPAHCIALGLLQLLPSEFSGTSIDNESSIPPELAKVVEQFNDFLPHSVMID